jgi:hypothetical protein
VGLELSLSFHSLVTRRRGGTLNLEVATALARDEAEEIEDEREVRDVSETIDSGDEAVETELASEERRTGW